MWRPLLQAQNSGQKAEKRIEALEEFIQNELSLELAQLPLPEPFHHHRLLYLRCRLLLDSFGVLDLT